MRIPVVDALKGFLVQVRQKHIDAAIPDDPAGCMYALAFMEDFESELVWVTRTRAYVEMKTLAGTSELIRCIVPEIVRQHMKANDLNLKAEIKPHNAFFAAPSASQRLDSVYKRQLRFNQKLAQKRKAAALERKVAQHKTEMARKAAQRQAERFARNPSLPIPVPEFFNPKPQPTKPKPERKKQDPTIGWEHGDRDGRGLYRF